MSTPILALHGFAGSGVDFLSLAAATPAWCWSHPDLPGHDPAGTPGPVGEWPTAPLDEAAGLAAVERWADALVTAISGPPPVLLGYSLGGRLALHAARRHPAAFRAVVLIGASAGLPTASERAARRAHDDAWAQRLLRDGLPDFLRAWTAQPLLVPVTPFPAAWAAARDARRTRLDARRLAGCLRTFGTGSLPWLGDDLPSLSMPVHLFAGAGDPAYVARAHDLAARMPKATVDIIPNAGHAALFECPEELLERVDGRLR